MSVTVHPGRLRQEIARRGWNPVDLAHAARLSPATVSAALRGKPISAASLNLMAQALARTPTIDLIDRLLFSDSPGLDVG
jgi:transcriptional regulator with XRE-family HTH domain